MLRLATTINRNYPKEFQQIEQQYLKKKSEETTEGIGQRTFEYEAIGEVQD